MDIHPLMKYEIAQMRNTEKLTRSLAAYDALRAREEQPGEREVVQTLVGRLRFVGRPGWRGAGARGPSRPAI